MVRRVHVLVFALALVAGFGLQQWSGLEAQSTGAITLMDAGTRTATTNGERVTLTSPQGMLLNLNVTAASGTTPTLDVKLQWQDPVTSTWNDLSGAVFQRITAAGSRTLTVYPAPEGRGLSRATSGTDPAAGAEVVEVVPADRRWRLITLTSTLSSDATVASRLPTLIFDDAVNELGRFGASTSLTASGGALLTWSTGIGVVGSTSNATAAPLPVDVILSGGSRFRTSTSGIQAGDNWNLPKFIVEEWVGNYSAMALPRYVRAVATIGGTSPSFTFTVSGAALK